MKKILLLLFGVLLAGCITKTPLFPSSSQGYEVYAWQKDGHKYFTLVTATSRYKSYEEITRREDINTEDWVKIIYFNTSDLKEAISQMPKNQYFIFVDYAYTPQYIVDELRLYVLSLEHEWRVQN